MKLTETHIRSFVDEPYFSRGKAYCSNGDVVLLVVNSQKVTAQVQGTRMYRVTLTLENNRFSGICTCPSFSDFGPCKHIAATGFAVIKHQKGAYRPSEESKRHSEDIDEFMQSLKKKKKEELIEIMVMWCEQYPELLDEM